MRKRKLHISFYICFLLCFSLPPALGCIGTSYRWVWYVSYSCKSSWGFAVMWHNNTFSCFLAGVNHPRRFAVRKCRFSSLPCTQAQRRVKIQYWQHKLSTVMIKHSDLKLLRHFTCEFRVFCPLPLLRWRNHFSFRWHFSHRELSRNQPRVMLHKLPS